MTEVVVTQHGRPATEALARVISSAKGGAPLAPVTVVVPSNFAGLVARRILGGGSLDSLASGIANVQFVTPFRFASLVATGVLRGKRPLTNPVLGAAVRQTLADDPGVFARVRDHQATEQAVASVVGELANVSSKGLAAIEEAGGFAASVVGVHRRVVARLEGFHDEAELAHAAAHRADLGDVLAPFGHVIWHLPGPITAPLAGFLRAVMNHGPSTVIVARTGARAAEREVDRALRIAGVDVPAPSDADTAPLASHVVSVSDADEEVRHVMREVVGLVESGVALDRIGIFHPVPDPYVRLLEQHFRAAGIVANGPSRRRLADSVAGRVITMALGLPAARWRRDRVMALITTGPLRSGDEMVRPSRWEALSRDAGVVMGRSDWGSKIDAQVRRLETQADLAVERGHDRRLAAVRRDQHELRLLHGFVDALGERIDAVSRAESWADRSQACVALLRGLLGPAHHHGSWPDAEHDAFERVEAVLDRLASLDEIEPGPSLSVFLRALDGELSVARERSGRFGQGLVYGPLSSAEGHDLDAVFVVGCAEGVLPAPRREDSLLPDVARTRTGGDLAPRLDQMHEQHRLFLAALAAAPAERRWLLFPRGDLRSSRRSRPSRWLLPSASQLAGRTLYATDFDRETPSGLLDVRSHAEAIASARHYVSPAERDLAEVFEFVRADGDPIDHPAAHSVRRGLIAQRARDGAAFTEFDGNLIGQRLPTTDEQPQSASRLETWAACGFRYFLAHVLGLSDRDDPERTIELSALDRGSAMHEILERFLREVVATGPPDPSDPWNDAQRARALAIAGDVFDDFEQRGRTGRSLLWRTQQSDLRASIEEFLDADDRHRAKHMARPAHFELAFGIDGEPPVELPIGDGRRLRFRGYIDRVDTAAGDRAIVSDYKTGRGSQYRKLESEDDPTVGGTLLQLGLYAEAAHQLLGATSVDTRYWMVNPKANYERYGYEWTPEHRQRLAEIVTTIVDGIEGGVFAAAPGDWDSFRRTYGQCTYCEFDTLCPRDRAEHASQKLASPELDVRVRLTRRPDSDEVES